MCRVAQAKPTPAVSILHYPFIFVTLPTSVCVFNDPGNSGGGLDKSISATICLNLCVFRDRLGIEVGYKAAEPTARLYLHFPSLQSRARAQSPLNGTRDRLCWENASQNTLVPNCHLLAWRNVKIPSEEIRREA